MNDDTKDKTAEDAGLSTPLSEDNALDAGHSLTGSVERLPDAPVRAEVNAEEASIIIEAAAETPVTELVEQPTPAEVQVPQDALDPQRVLDPIDANAIRIFGEQYAAIKEKCAELGIDYAGHVLTVCSKLNDLESKLELELGDFERSLPPEVWKAIGHAIGVNHTIENCRRQLMMAIETGLIRDQPAQAMADLFYSMSYSMNSFVNATLSELIGNMTLGFDKATVKSKIIDPFNAVMQIKRDTFDMIGEANGQFGQKLMHAIASAATGQAAVAAAQPETVEVQGVADLPPGVNVH